MTYFIVARQLHLRFRSDSVFVGSEMPGNTDIYKYIELLGLSPYHFTYISVAPVRLDKAIVASGI